MSSYLLKQADKITLALVGAACLAALGDAYVKRSASVEGGQKVVDAMKTEKERLKTENSQSSSMQSHQVLNTLGMLMHDLQSAALHLKAPCTAPYARLFSSNAALLLQYRQEQTLYCLS